MYALELVYLSERTKKRGLLIDSGFMLLLPK